jgi:uncharacterized protein YvpB
MGVVIYYKDIYIPVSIYYRYKVQKSTNSEILEAYSKPFESTVIV